MLAENNLLFGIFDRVWWPSDNVDSLDSLHLKVARLAFHASEAK